MFLRPTLKVVMKNDGYFVDVILIYHSPINIYKILLLRQLQGDSSSLPHIFTLHHYVGSLLLTCLNLHDGGHYGHDHCHRNVQFMSVV